MLPVLKDFCSPCTFVDIVNIFEKPSYIPLLEFIMPSYV